MNKPLVFCIVRDIDNSTVMPGLSSLEGLRVFINSHINRPVAIGKLSNAYLVPTTGNKPSAIYAELKFSPKRHHVLLSKLSRIVDWGMDDFFSFSTSKKIPNALDLTMESGSLSRKTFVTDNNPIGYRNPQDLLQSYRAVLSDVLANGGKA